MNFTSNHLERLAQKRQKNHLRCSSLAQNALLMRSEEKRCLRWADDKEAETPITACHNRRWEKSMFECTAVEPWSRWVTAAQDHSGCHSCRQTAGPWGYNWQGLYKKKKADRRFGKKCAWSDESQFQRYLDGGGQNFAWTNWKPGSSQPAGGGVAVWWIFSLHISRVTSSF